ncbi:toll-like receptor 4 [Mytilus trossulus]|uniref:toll-like receptor 4 n=1 Tax=Mytilus trossulus TaxID=6551 RepID=UPI00300538DF
MTISIYLILILHLNVVLNCEHSINLTYTRLCEWKIRGKQADVLCNIKRDMEWSFNDFGKWRSCYPAISQFYLTVSCSAGVSIALHRPLEVLGMHSINIESCYIKNFYEVSSRKIRNNINYLRSLKIGNSVFEFKDSDMWKSVMINSDSLIHTCEFSVFLNEFILRNISTKYIMDMQDISSQQMDEMKERMKNVSLQKRECAYKQLKYFEISACPNSFTYTHIHDIFSKSVFSQLKTLNLSMNGLKAFPTVLSLETWSTKFGNLRQLDFSNNNITQLDFLSTERYLQNLNFELNLSNNNIRLLTKADLHSLKYLYYKNVIVNLRCNREMKCLCKTLSVEQVFRTTWGQNYSYLKSACVENCNIDLDTENTNQQFIAYSGLIFFFSFVTLVTSSLLCLRRIFRKNKKTDSFEVQSTFHSAESIYDAFISYSSMDEHWIYNTLVHNLESHIPGIRLCLHQRDFVPGATIAENIIRSIDESTHTLVVLTENFTKSEWCQMEFQKAFHQTLKHRKHLIVIVLGDLDTSTLNRDITFCIKTYTFLKVSEILFWPKLYNVLSE